MVEPYQGFSFSSAWVGGLGYSNSGRVLRFDAFGHEQALPWGSQDTGWLDSGTYKVSMWVLIDENYDFRKVFAAKFQLQNRDVSSVIDNPQLDHSMYAGCEGLWSGKEAARGVWHEVVVRIKLPAAASSVRFEVLGGGSKGRFMSTGLSLVRPKVSVRFEPVVDQMTVTRQRRREDLSMKLTGCRALFRSGSAPTSGSRSRRMTTARSSIATAMYTQA
jgi:hypothetical protein